MNTADYCTNTTTHDTEVLDKNGNATTETVAETVLTIEHSHKTAEKMHTKYALNDRQNEYSTLLFAENIAPVWGKLLGGFSLNREYLVK